MKLSLNVKTVAGVTTLIIVVASVLTLTHTSRQQQILTQEFARLTQALAHTLAFNSEYGVLVGDRQGLQDFVDGVLREPDVVYAAVLDHDLHALAKGERDAAGTLIGSVLPPTLTPQTVVRFVGPSGRRVCVVEHPVMLMRRQRWSEGGLITVPTETSAELIGVAVVGMSTRSLGAYFRDLQRTTLTVTAFIVLAAWFLSCVLVSFLTGPLRQLKVATQQVAAGDLDVRLPSRTQDEVGDLTQSFNQMVSEIRQSRDRIQDYTKQLETTARELASVNLEMEDLLRVVSHDLRAPLINIQGFSRRLEPIMQETVKTLDRLAVHGQNNGMVAEIQTLKDSLQHRFAESLRFIGKGVEKMDSLLASLLAVSRVGRKADPAKPNDLDSILDDVLATFDHQLREQAITVIRHPLPAGIVCRRNEINQAFSNLISNAIKFMGPTGDRFIEITGADRADHGECAIRDTGIGIDPEDQERIFQMFTRLQAIEAPGEGVGLAYVKKIIRSHGGRIWVVSKRGQGSTFTFTLPKRPEAAADGQEQLAAAQKGVTA